MAVAKIGSLVTFVGGTTILASEMNTNFADVKGAFNALVSGVNEITVDTIAEVTPGNGVVVDGVTLKDGGASGAGNASFVNGVLSGTLDVTGNGTFAADVTVTGTLTAGTLVFTSGVTLQGSAPTPLNYDIRYEIQDTESAPSAQFYADSTIATPTAGTKVQALAGYSYGLVPDTVSRLAEVVGVRGTVEAALDGSSVQEGITDIYGGLFTVNVAFGGNPDKWVRNAYGIKTVWATNGGALNAYGAYLGRPGGNALSSRAVTLYLEDPSSSAVEDITVLAESGAKLTTAGVWEDASSRDLKSGIRDVDLQGALAAFQATRVRQFVRRGRDVEELGVVADELPAILQTDSGRSVSATQLAALALAVLKDHEARLQFLGA